MYSVRPLNVRKFNLVSLDVRYIFLDVSIKN